jgi:hypothetical protein
VNHTNVYLQSELQEQQRNALILQLMHQTVNARNDSSVLKEGVGLLDLFFSRVTSLDVALQQLQQILSTTNDSSQYSIQRSDEVLIKQRKSYCISIATSLILCILTASQQERIRLNNEYQVIDYLSSSIDSNNNEEFNHWTHTSEMRQRLRRHISLLTSTIHNILSAPTLNSMRIELYRKQYEFCNITLYEYNIKQLYESIDVDDNNQCDATNEFIRAFTV